MLKHWNPKLSRLKSRRQRRPRTKYLFFLPIAILTTIVAYGYYASSQPGTLVVEASDASSQNDLSVPASVNGMLVTAPSTLALPQGIYTVTFGQLQWYQTPSPKTVSLPAGRTVYALGEYIPTPEIIRISSAGFDIARISAKGGLTPVVWVNTSTQFAVLLGDQFNRVIINPNQNFTYVYQSSGHFQYSIWQTSFTGSVDVV